ncbi:MAG TPA: phosphoglycerate kinase [Chthoniobacteraceae bacterium]|nr:phosphoglycerate kinase [Chthoniobacteraceae bacterium]
MGKLSVRDIDVRDKRVLLRVDFNVPTEKAEGGQQLRITDDTRIRESLPTIELLRERGAKLIIMAHFGRPKGKRVAEFSLAPVSEYLRTALRLPVTFSPETVGDVPREIIAKMNPGEIVLLENVRFHPGEEANDPDFAKALAALGEIYVNDAFGAAHRAHASTAGIARFVEKAAMGLLMEKELHYLQGELEKPARPFLVILGGAKVSDKIGVIKALMEKADGFLIGGAMAYTFFKAQGIPIGNSRFEADKLDLARELLDLAKSKGVRFLLPVDNLQTQDIGPGAVPLNTGVHSTEHGVDDGYEAVDIGSRTIEIFCGEIAKAKTILWNGPVGIFEIPEFANGTRRIAEALAASSATTIIGGGDSVTAVKQAGLGDQMTFISTGGGASLELLEGQVLPGVAALNDA